MSKEKTALYAQFLEFTRDATLHTLSSVPDAKRLTNLKEGKGTPLWLAGHLANTINTVVLRWMLQAESVVPKEIAVKFAPDFAGGLPPSTDPAQYPSWDEVVALYTTATTRAAEGVRALDDSALPEPLAGRMPDPLRALFSSNEVTLRQMITHDAYHRGQIGLISNL